MIKITSVGLLGHKPLSNIGLLRISSDTDFCVLISNAICVGNFNLTQLCVRMALDGAI